MKRSSISTNRIVFIFLLSAITLFLLETKAYAHAGKTDWQGGHTDRETGDYHYHHGYPAHDHYDMDGDGKADCPYDFDDKTNHSSSTTGKSSGSSTGYTYPELETISRPTLPTQQEETSVPTQNTPIETKEDKMTKHLLFVVAFLIFVIIILLLMRKHSKEEIESLKMEMIKEDNIHKNELRKSELARLELQESYQRELEEEKKQAYVEIKENKRKIKAELSRFDEMLRKKYGDDYLYLLFGAKKHDYVGFDNLPASEDGSSADWGEKYTFFASSSKKSNIYHKYTCYHAGPMQINAYTIYSSGLRYVPCRVCNPELPNLDWYIKYREVIKFRETYLN